MGSNSLRPGTFDEHLDWELTPVETDLANEQNKADIKVSRSPVVRLLLVCIGWLAVALGVLGIFLPLLPTTPFLLLAAACFVRSSPAFYRWLLGHPRLGKYIHYYLSGAGMPMKAKIYTLILIWASMLLSAFVLTDSWIPKVILPLIGLAVSLYILRLPTLNLAAPHDPTTEDQSADSKS